MPHEIDKETLSAYLDGELPESRKAELTSHVASCPDCSGYLERVRSASADFKKHGLVQAPAAKAPSKSRGLQLAVAFAVLTFVVMAGGAALKRFMPTLFSQIQGMITSAAGSMGSGGH
jgi:anti-sigma factor RsiW